jgi:hypothetical protein
MYELAHADMVHYWTIQGCKGGARQYMVIQETSGVAHYLVPGYARKAKQWLVHGGGI